jgi:CheY-like chemotaxis protein
MPEEAEDKNGGAWNVLVVEDDETVRRQIKEYLEDEVFAFRKLHMSDIGDLSEALNLIKERKADLVILDVYRGAAKPGGEQTGVLILESIKKSGFVPVVLYTALPEGLEEHKSIFIRLVGKDAGGLEKLKTEIGDLFRLFIPQMHRAVVNHLDQALSSYMWEFVQQHWGEFEPIVEKPEFLRLVIQRLAMAFTHQGIEEMTRQVYGTPAAGAVVDADKVHPAEYYIKPPIGKDPLLGDIRIREDAGNTIYLVVLWPSCDMVSTAGREPKTDCVLCARAKPAKDAPEVVDWTSSPSSNKQKSVEGLIKNMRDKSPDRYHFLPGVWDLPNLVVDFQDLEHVKLETIRGLRCLGTLASPFAEAVATRFQRYIGRVGTLDLDLTLMLTRISK